MPILDSPKAKRIVSKCGKCSLRTPPQLLSRVLQRVTGLEGRPLQGKHWMVGEGLLPHPSANVQSGPAVSGCVPFRSFSSILSVELSGGHVEQLGRFVGVTDSQADGSDVLQSLHDEKKGV